MTLSDIQRDLDSVADQLAEAIEPFEDDQKGGKSARKLVKTIEEVIEQLENAVRDADELAKDIDDKIDELRDLM